jgi:two-component system sensor histidine kinase BarA
MSLLKPSIQNKLLLLAMMPATFIAVAITIYTTNIRIGDIHLLMNEKAEAIAEQIASESVNNIFTGNKEQVRRNVSRYLNHYKELYKIRISSTNELYAAEQKASIPTSPSIYSFAEITLIQSDVEFDDLGLETSFIDTEPAVIGKVEIWLLDQTHAQKQDIIQTSFIMLFVIVFAMLVIIFPMSRHLTTPIRELAHSFSLLADGKYDVRVDESSRDEILSLQKGFNEMSLALANQHEKLHDEVTQVTRDLNTTLQALEIQNIELDIARKLAVESSRIKSEFVANMSHEIRTPMNGIIGFISLLEKTGLDKEQQGYLSTINHSAKTLLHILNDILDFSKLEAGKIETHNSIFPVEELISHVIDIFTPQAHSKKLNLIPLIFNDVPRNICGDRQHLAQVLSNLISNAIKFTQQGEVVIRVAVEEYSSHSCVLAISISDTGIGISEKNIANLFQPFKQVSSDFSRGFGGTGLGLSISRSLVKIMKGNISVESVEGKGSIFNVTLPVELPSHTESTMETRDFDGKLIQLYDSHRLSRLSFLNTFENMGFRVKEYETLATFENAVESADSSLCVISLGTDETVLLDENRLPQINNIACPVILLVSTSDQQLMDNYAQQFDCTVIKRPTFQHQLAPLFAQLLGMEQHVEQQSHSVTDAQDIKLVNKSILIVDDNKINQDLLATIFQPTGASLSLANNGQEALDAFNHTKFDLVFMDIHMPEMNGIDATRALRKTGYSGPIVALTADTAFLDKGVSSNYGFDSVLIKPIETDALNQILNDFSTGKKIDRSHHPVANHQQALSTSQLITRDLQQALRIADGQEEVAEKLFMTLLEQLPEYLDSARQQVSNRNWQKLWDVLHKLHGATSVCGVPALNNAVKNLQQFIEKQDYHSIDAGLKKLNQEASRLLTYTTEDS